MDLEEVKAMLQGHPQGVGPSTERMALLWIIEHLEHVHTNEVYPDYDGPLHYWCQPCHVYHNSMSKIGRKHIKNAEMEEA